MTLTRSQVSMQSTEAKQSALHFNLGAPANGTYTFVLSEDHSGTVDTIIAKTASGTATLEIRIDNVPIVVSGGGSTMSITSTENSKATSSANAYGSGATLTAVITSSSSPVDLAVTVKRTRTA